MSKIAYKGFNKDWKCRDFQYKVGKEYKIDSDIEMCKNGFHCCENPIDVFNYYNDIDGKYAEVEILGNHIKENDKTVTANLKINKELSFWDIFKLNMKIVVDLCIKSTHANTSGYGAHANTSGDYAHANTSGDYAHANTSGYKAHANTSGNDAHANTSGYGAHANTSGYKAHANTSGDYAHANTSGNYAHANTSGYRAHANTSGNYAHANTSGDESHANTSGDESHANTSGKNCIAVGLGYANRAKTKLGWIVLAEHDKDGNIIHIKTGKVGKQIKSDVWYELKNNKFVAVK